MVVCMCVCTLKVNKQKVAIGSHRFYRFGWCFSLYERITDCLSLQWKRNVSFLIQTHSFHKGTNHFLSHKPSTLRSDWYCIHECICKDCICSFITRTVAIIAFSLSYFAHLSNKFYKHFQHVLTLFYIQQIIIHTQTTSAWTNNEQKRAFRGNIYMDVN